MLAVNDNKPTSRPMLAFLSPSQIRAHQPPPGHCLVGDNHIQRGAPFVIGGAPGVGKSRAATRLAIFGVTRTGYFGMPVHRQFRTMILQCENGRIRLKSESLDPWNRLARDEKGKDYTEAFERTLSVLPPGDDAPAIGIIAHTRKTAP